MRILGIDCGAQRTGYGVIETDGSRHHLVASGLIRMSSRQPLASRLVEISVRLRSVIAEFRPEAGAVEEVFAAVNIRSSMVLAHVRGVALLAIAEAGLEFGEYSPLEVKTSVVGYGRAEKSQVQVMVGSLLQLDSAIQSTDVCDALAVAICHATRRSLANLAKITA